MDEPQPVSTRAWRPRVSLLTALLLLTIVAMAIVIVQVFRQLDPLRAEVRRLRAEQGYLSIDDPQKAYVVKGFGEPLRFGGIGSLWRIYLPPSEHYWLFCSTGKLPPWKARPGREWFESLKREGTWSAHAPKMQGEFWLEARLLQDGDKKKVCYRFGSGDMTDGSIFTDLSSGKPLTNQSTVFAPISMDMSNQRSFEPDEPILFWYEGKSVKPSHDVVDGVAVWIERRQNVNPSALNGKQ
jgi:hypothetical protein